MPKSALVIGASGLTGFHLVNILLKDERYNRITCFLRREIPLHDEKLEQYFINFDTLSDYHMLFKADELYICIGTTISKAGGIKSFMKTDLSIPVQISEICRNNNVRTVCVISSVGANPDSKNYYLATKGKLEKQIEKMGFPHYYFLRPSLLKGKRNEFRFLEKISKALLWLGKPFLRGKLEKYKGIRAEDVAMAMKKVANGLPGKHTYESDEIIKLSRLKE